MFCNTYDARNKVDKDLEFLISVIVNNADAENFLQSKNTSKKVIVLFLQTFSIYMSDGECKRDVIPVTLSGPENGRKSKSQDI